MTRREEIRALEGRRQALEALKKAALDSEKEFLGKLDDSSALAKNTQVLKFNKDDDDNEVKNEKLVDMEPFHKKFQRCMQNFYNDAEAFEDNNEDGEEEEEDIEKLREDLFDAESYPLVNMKEQKDKELLKEKLENLQEKKRQVDKLLEDLNRLKEKACVNEDNEVKQKPKEQEISLNYSTIKSELNQNQNELDIIKSSVSASGTADNTAKKAEKIINLLENQEKLEYVCFKGLDLN